VFLISSEWFSLAESFDSNFLPFYVHCIYFYHRPTGGLVGSLLTWFWLLTFQSSVDVILVIGRHPIVVWDRKYLGIGRVQRKAWISIFRVFVGVSELEVW
jgi:hypothetical protein